MTDSVNCDALRETRRTDVGAGELIDLATERHGLAQMKSWPIIPLGRICVYLCESVAEARPLPQAVL